MTLLGSFYRKFHGRIVSRPTNFSWVIPGKLAGSGLPSSYDHLLWLAKNEIKSVVTVREIPLPDAWFKKLNSLNLDLEYYFVKTDDYDAPTIDEMDKAVKYIDWQIKRNNPVVVHCAAGKGRTGTLLAAYFIKTEGLNPYESIKRIRSLRPGSIQSQKQEIALEYFYGHFK